MNKKTFALAAAIAIALQVSVTENTSAQDKRLGIMSRAEFKCGDADPCYPPVRVRKATKEEGGFCTVDLAYDHISIDRGKKPKIVWKLAPVEKEPGYEFARDGIRFEAPDDKTEAECMCMDERQDYKRHGRDRVKKDEFRWDSRHKRSAETKHCFSINVVGTFNGKEEDCNYVDPLIINK